MGISTKLNIDLDKYYFIDPADFKTIISKTKLITDVIIQK